ncbi:ATP-dependent DNA helicase UvrD2 [Tessaracoccus sp. MC1627]|uniref:ATP-dependent DNA helicase UvrD2 n=1 Tax=Tessaracoccus sp. MC1627 TaxID=2760312 RepID=UPI0016036532|nr:ATP-dependent DNA helicase UvrD2 [Tessaracoccus sp. MC1627]MBB1513973.1 ATP-dependent DNA helicase UvrD2 [Tessaracoccus sp. MC1627]
MRDHILEALDPEQRRVATLLDAPVVVLAGAGTGKTRAITHRIAHAVSQGRYQPSATLAVTFTTRAAGEMRARLASLGVRGAQARTIHSAALRQCQFFWPQAYGVEFPRVAENTFGLVARAAHQVLGKSDTPLVRDLDSEISWAKTSNVSASRYPDVAQRRSVAGASAAQVSAVMALYEKQKVAEGTVDFNDILMCNAVLLTEHEEIGATIRQTYRHFVVDEYQDVSALQHRLITLWVDGRQDVCVVGDPNQAIHSFAGADASYLLGFAAGIEGAETLRLFRNYRSTPEVISSANKVLRVRPGGPGALTPTRASGPKPTFSGHPDEASEAGALADWLKQRHAAGTSWSELAVLYRINAQSPSLEAALSERAIPYSVRGTEKFYDRAEVRQALLEFGRAVERGGETEAPAVLESVLGSLGWRPEAPAGQGRQRERWESLSALRGMVVDEAAARGTWPASEAAEWLRERSAWQAGPVAEAVTLATLHAAKGLEWDGVAIVGVREGMIPFVLSQEEPSLSEERRLLYVGFTRAKRELRVSWAAGKGSATRSRFIADQVSGPSTVARKTKEKATSARSRTCRVCGLHLHTAAERKLSRHPDCEVSYDEGLFEALRAWRKAAADEASVPAFVVFTDATLQAIAEAAPATEADLLRLPGIGRVKVERYGGGALKVVRSHQG